MPDAPEDARKINEWLIGEGRRSGDALVIVSGYVQRLLDAGIPISRARIAQRTANPLLAAWGLIWTKDGAEEYTVPRAALSTIAWYGSPFEHVLTTQQPLHRSLIGLKPEDHQVYHDLAAGGGTDFYASLLDYGDGSLQACSYVTARPSGFEAREIEIMEATRSGLASALEPVAMRRSTQSLLTAYLGSGPATAVFEGTIERGQQVQTEAAIMFADLRGFTQKTVTWPEADLLAALDDYFEAVVEAVRKNQGDVLKLLGDGVLAMFPAHGSPDTCCQSAVLAAQLAQAGIDAKNRTRSDQGKAPLAAGFGLSFGPVTYGNIGSLDRLDFTVLGVPVNRASRIQDLCKSKGETILLGEEVAQRLSIPTDPIGDHELRGLPGRHAIYAPRRR
ncbi:MAG: adenylate/guanylate cyclase domain-containing protein [Pseudomonadota bacterium]